MKIQTILLVCICLLSASARVLLESTSKSREFSLVHSAPPSANIDLTFSLKVSEVAKAELKNTLLKVSDPQSEYYGQYLSKDQVTALLKVEDETVEVLRSYLKAHGVLDEGKVELHGTALVVTMSVEKAEEILETNFFRYCHNNVPGYCLFRAQAYTVDEEISQIVDFVGGVLHFPSLDRFTHKDGAEIMKKRQIGWTPRALRDLFNTTYASPIKGSGNRQAVASFIGQYFDEPDLQEFFTLFYQSGIGSTPSKVIGVQGILPGVEANLDVQYLMGASDLVDTWVYSNAGEHEGQEPFLKWLMILAKTDDKEIPKTISASYGDDENSIDIKYIKSCDVQFQALGVRGVSVMFASGDSGASCTSKGNRFLPGWPATSPWVTAVGGTVGGRGDLEGDFISGGGFSDVFPGEKYQGEAVAAYLDAAQKAGALPPSTYFNSSNRGFPDVGSPSEGFLVVSYLIPSPVGGTSAACPSFTSVISLLNEIQLSAGKSSLGFLNPWLYSNAEKMMQPVNSGCNGGCSSNNGQGFCAVKNQGTWSPVSGLGVPDFWRMVQQLPSK